MKGVKLDGNNVVRIIDMPEPQPGPGEVVVATAVSAICGSEMGPHRNDGHPTGNDGHESAGIVVRIGEGVRRSRSGSAWA